MTPPIEPQPGPKRIQRSRTKGWKMPEGAVYVGCGTDFGNPYPISKGRSTWQGVTTDIWQVGTCNGHAMWFRDSKSGAAELSVRAFRAYCPPRSALAEAARRVLRGKDLACWCKLDEPCHADVLLELANAEPSDV
jgi:hypothetical protein